jgi:hypothetical protein
MAAVAAARQQRQQLAATWRQRRSVKKLMAKVTGIEKSQHGMAAWRRKEASDDKE